MAVISGKLGSIQYSSGDVTIKSWTLNAKAELYDSTNFDSCGGYREYVAGFTDWSGSYEGYYSTGNTVTPGSSGRKIVLRTVAAGGAGVWSGTALITGMDIGIGVDGLVTQSYTFQGTGALAQTSQYIKEVI